MLEKNADKFSETQFRFPSIETRTENDCVYLEDKTKLKEDIKLMVSAIMDVREEFLTKELTFKLEKLQKEFEDRQVVCIEGLKEKVDSLEKVIDKFSNGWTREFIEKQQEALSKILDAKFKEEQDNRDIVAKGQERKWGRLDKWLDFLLKALATGGIIYIAVEWLLEKLA